MKILLTGCTGFIGKHLSEALISSGIALSAIVEAASERDDLESKGIGCFVDCERATSSMLQFFNDNRFDGVIHLASCFLVEHKPEDVSGLISTNLLFSTRVLEAAVQSNVRWFINTGTFWQHFNNNDYSPVNLYAATKQAFQTIAQYYIEIIRDKFCNNKT
jgi:nucleoside-diphosphate-sugar epimerase